MRCPLCHGMQDRVLDSRPLKDGRAIRRRRECLGCGHRFTTYEYIEEEALVVVKSDGRREPFNRTKIQRGIQIACTKRPVSATQMEELVAWVEVRLNRLGKREVNSRTVGELVMERLRWLDEVAYVRFASVYREFKDKDEFLQELRQLDRFESSD